MLALASRWYRGLSVNHILHIPVDHELSDRARWLISVRWLFLALGVTITLVANRLLDGVLPLGSLLATFVGMAICNLALWVVAHRLISRTAPLDVHAMLLHMQIVLDLLAVTLLLHFSGGLENPFSTYYVLIVAVGSILTTRRASYGYAILASFLWVGLLLAEACGLVPHHNLVGFRIVSRYQEPLHIISESFVLTSANLGVALFASTIIERLRKGEQELYEASTSCEIRASELAELNSRMQEANASCELRTQELADLNRQLQESNASCELRTQELDELNQRLQESNLSCELRAGELADLNARLKEYDHTRSLFIRLTTHELRAPVAAIQSYLRLILDGYVPEDRLREVIAKAEQRARDQLDLISDLLDLARAQEPKAVVKPVDMAAVLRDVVDLQQAGAQDKALSLMLDIASDLPPVIADADHIKQIWTNLVSNAIKYTPDKGQVHVTLKAEGDMLRGSVSDTGIGMSPAEQKHVFENFYRTEAAKAMSHHGTGLGLSIVQGIMQHYGGRIWVESEVGRGSTFTFELPKGAP
jgi:signal transduction histidine kinase